MAWPPGFQSLCNALTRAKIHSFELGNVWDEVVASSQLDSSQAFSSPPGTPSSNPGLILREMCLSQSVSLRDLLIQNKELNALAKQAELPVTELARFLPHWAEHRRLTAPAITLASELSLTYVSTGCPNLDKLLGGGLLQGTLTELVGSSKTGKSTLLLQMAFTSLIQAKDPKSIAVLIDTEKGVIAGRVAQLRANSFPGLDLERLAILEVRDALSLEETLHSGLEQRLGRAFANRPLSIIVVDSVSILQEKSQSTVGGPVLLDLVALHLRRLAHKYNVPIAMANQVRAALPLQLDSEEGNNIMLIGNQERWVTGWTEDRYVVDSSQGNYGQTLRPALGFEWTAAIDTRLALKQDLGSAMRTVQIVFSHNAPKREMELVIDDYGVHGKEI